MNRTIPLIIIAIVLALAAPAWAETGTAQETKFEDKPTDNRDSSEAYRKIIAEMDTIREKAENDPRSLFKYEKKKTSIGIGEVISILLLMIYLAFTRSIAKSLNRSAFGWCLVCLFLPGLGALLLAYVAAKHTVACPQCNHIFATKESRNVEEIEQNRQKYTRDGWEWRKK